MPEEVRKELDELKSKPAGTVLTAEQQEKLKEYEIMAQWLRDKRGED
ncbi:MAG: hypothetical protein NY202_02510 [Mollicutes bacterium UO1]